VGSPADHSANGGTFAAAARWTFGDGASGGGLASTHSYAQASSYTVTQTLTDNDGPTGSVSKR
jgi:chitodextrinase